MSESGSYPGTTSGLDVIPTNSQAQAAERLGYPTQKPPALLERILAASSNPGDCRARPVLRLRHHHRRAAQKLGRRWIGIDITHLSIALMKYRLKDMFGLVEKQDYLVKGEPETSPRRASWPRTTATSSNGGRCRSVKGAAGGQRRAGRRRRTKDEEKSVLGPSSFVGKKGADKGIDGVITFIDEAGGKANACSCR